MSKINQLLEIEKNGILKSNNAILFYTKNCKCIIYKNDDSFVIEKKKLVFICRGDLLKIIPLSADDIYECFVLTPEILSHIRLIFTDIFGYDFPNKKAMSTIKKIISLDPDGGNIELFRNAILLKNKELCALRLSLLLSKYEDSCLILQYIYNGYNQLISDKIRLTIDKDISYKWKLSDISEKLMMPEYIIRKQIRKEGTTFNEILTKRRMNKAYLLLESGNYNVSQVSRLVGICSLSYFIKVFSNYYGITPKQFIKTLI
ncbi:TPA: helix-turn-helix transcriptional regulator [Escherichia coli]|nr:helix-turn-helix transcriptional regulator [Escherichia coli]HBA7654996.1 helix-turn-helix transcriptional regulator [Escherichia coli]HBA7728498.1 helix-turn-helix transcriptional regulator [Escherichia coli]HBA7869886.1 helix-turn-helix transcriptional regulator [Escherichia coli]